jgi:hypothetical protein
MTTAVVDHVGAVITRLKADAIISALVSTRVFAPSLPEAESASMPRKCIVVKPSGGSEPGYASGDLKLQAPRVDVFCYGENSYEADRVRRAARAVLKESRRVVSSGVLLHWIKPAGGAITFNDPDAEWPGSFDSYQVLASETSAA